MRVPAAGRHRRRARRGRARRITDWPQILALYQVLERMSDNPMVSLNRARLRGHYHLDAVRGHLHERAGDVERAIAHYRAAAERTASIPERDYLTLKAARFAAGPDLHRVW